MALKRTPPKKDPNQAPPDGDDDADATDDDVGITRAEVVKLINGAVSGQLARKLPAAIEAGMAPVLAKLDSFKPPAADDDEEDDGDEVADLPAPDRQRPRQPDKRQPDKATLKLSKQVGDLQRQIKERDDNLAAEKTARQGQTIEAALTESLTKLGVDPLRLRGALAVHRSAASVDDKGRVIYKVERDGYDEDLTPAEALTEWGATDEGKSYLAPTGSTGGAGARPPRATGPARKPAPNTPEGKAVRHNEARQSLLGAVSELVAGGSIAIE